MSYTSNYMLAKDEQLLQQLTGALPDVADDVFAEGAGVADHDLRMALVALAGPVGSAYRRFAEEMALQLVTTMAVSLETTDAEMKTAVAQLWTPYAKLMEERGAISVVVAP